jgi:hypothetical protein
MVVPPLQQKDDGEDYTLKPTPNAIKTLSATYDGLTGCLDRLRRMDFNAFVNVINIGTNTKGQAAKDLEPHIFATPMGDLVGPLVEYVAVLMNGGRPLENVDSDDSEGDEGNG